jgi:hypothetical protein
MSMSAAAAEAPAATELLAGHDSEDEDTLPPLAASAAAALAGGSPVAAGARLEELALERARRRYDLEDPYADKSWSLHKKHIFILSSAGKPIFSRYGDESKLAPTFGVLQALISFVSDQGDTIRYIKAGGHHIVFLMRGPLYLVAASSVGEPVQHTWRQLGILHAQIFSILTSKVESIFARNASYDARGLLGGTDRVMRSLLHSAAVEPTLLLQATPVLRMPPLVRDELAKLLLSVCAKTDVLFGVLVAHNHLVTLLRPKRTALHPDDLLLVMNTVGSSFSFREDEVWLPICLPKYNAAGFLYGHVSFVLPELCLVLLTPKADGFGVVAECRAQFVARLEHQNDFRASILASLAQPQYSIDQLGVPEVRHYLFRVPASVAGLEQYTAPRTGCHAGPQSPYHDTSSVRRLMRHYMLAHDRVHHTSGKGPLREYMQLSEDEMTIVWTSAKTDGLGELYAVFSPLVSKPVAYAACHKLLRKLKKEMPQLLMLHAAVK